ncbi:MAG: hypothetical protein NVSMB55_25080 [Mycobacteriales bacterium]
MASRSVSALFAGIALAATAAAVSLPAASAVSGGLAEGREAAPVIVTVGSGSAAHAVRRTHRTRRATHRPPALTNLSTAPAPVAAPAAPTATTATNAPADHAGSYTFMSEVAPGNPIRWNPCTTIHWAFNPAGAPAGGLAAVQSAVARVGAATGLHFAYDGTATDVPTSAYIDAQTGANGFRPLLVGWSTPSASTLLANQPASLVGMDQTIWAGPAGGATNIVSGVIALNADVTAPTSGSNSWYTFVLHELGHAVGLGHTTDATQIMAPIIPAAAADYGSGDLAGLAKVGGTC